MKDLSRAPVFAGPFTQWKLEASSIAPGVSVFGGAPATPNTNSFKTGGFYSRFKSQSGVVGQQRQCKYRATSLRGKIVAGGTSPAIKGRAVEYRAAVAEHETEMGSYR